MLELAYISPTYVLYHYCINALVSSATRAYPYIFITYIVVVFFSLIMRVRSIIGSVVFSKENCNFLHLQNRKIFYSTFTLLEEHCCQRKIQQSCLTSTKDSAWRKLYADQCHAAMITLTDLDCCTFNELKNQFELFSPASLPLPPLGR